MTINLIFSNGQSTTTNVAPSFTDKMIDDCYLNKDYYGLGIVVRWNKSYVTVY